MQHDFPNNYLLLEEYLKLWCCLLNVCDYNNDMIV